MTILVRVIFATSVLGGLLSVETEVQPFVGDCGSTNDPKMEIAGSVGLRSEAKLERNLASSVILAAAMEGSPPSLGSRNKLCSKRHLCGDKCEWAPSRWFNEPSFASCSGALVTKDVVVTAMHCLCNYGESDIDKVRVRSSHLSKEDEDGWRSVKKVLRPMGGDAACAGSCCDDFVFLMLSDELGPAAVPVMPRSAEVKRGGPEGSYMISSPFGIPGVLSRGQVQPSRALRCADHDMYSVWQSSGGAIYSMENGDFLGVHLQSKSPQCSYPRTNRQGQILFPEPDPKNDSGEFLGLSQEVITKHLEEGIWMTASEWNTNQRRSDCSLGGKEGLKGNPGTRLQDWSC